MILHYRERTSWISLEELINDVKTAYFLTVRSRDAQGAAVHWFPLAEIVRLRSEKLELLDKKN